MGTTRTRNLRPGLCACSAAALATAFSLLPIGPLPVGSALAQAANGSIRGTVTDLVSGTTLAGARVTLVDLDRRVDTDRSGDFVLTDVPPGAYGLRFEYLGLPTRTATIVVTSGVAAQLNLALGAAATVSADATTLDEIVVTGTVTSTTRKLNEERSASALTEIAASDVSSEFPDRNLGEILQRLTGVFVDRNGTGEGNILLLRGISAANNLVLVEGLRLPSGRADGRTPNLATINSDVISSAEVRKVFTPEIPGDFFGGYVNARQLSAFDRSRPFFTTSAQFGLRSTEQTGMDREFSARASTFLTEHIGLAGAIGFDERDATFNQYNATRSPNGTAAIPALTPTLLQYRLAQGKISRYSANMTLDYVPSETSRFFLKAFYNYGLEETVDQRVNAFFGPSPASGSGPVVGSFPTVIPEIEYIKIDRIETFASLVAGGEHEREDWGVTYSLGYNRLNADQDPANRFALRSPISRPGGVTYDFSRRTEPALTFGNPALLTTLTNYGTTISTTTNTAETFEEQVVGQLNIARVFRPGLASFELRGGLRFDERHRESDVGGAQPYAGIPLTADLAIVGPSGLFRDQFGLPFILNGTALAGLFTTPPSTRPPGDPNFLASIAGDFDSTDKIYSSYLMGTYERGPLRIISGVRYERTDLAGNNVVINRATYRPTDPDPLDADFSDGVAPRRVTSEYAKWLPSFVVRYEPRDNVLVRFAASKTYARPTSSQLFLGETISPGTVGTFDRSVTRGNPALVPQDAWNVDASIDFYGSQASVIRFGVFYKSISNVFYTASVTEPNTAGGTDFVSVPQNGGDAHVAGAEAALIQSLGFMTPALQRFSVETNVGITSSNQEVLSAAGLVIRETQLEQSYRFVGNASLVYRDSWGRARLAYRYSGKRLNAIDINPIGGFNDAFRDSSSGVDTDISYNVTDRLSASIQVRNVFNDLDVVEYLGVDPSAMTRTQYSGRYIGIGLNFRIQ